MRTSFRLDSLAFKIELKQAGRDNFTVVYGKQIKHSLNYYGACLELGAAIMHALACDGKLDNREIGEE